MIETFVGALVGIVVGDGSGVAITSVGAGVGVGGIGVAVGGILVAVGDGVNAIAVSVICTCASAAPLVEVASAKRATWVCCAESGFVGFCKLQAASMLNRIIMKTIFFIFPCFQCPGATIECIIYNFRIYCY
jgi:hypothetical protein